MFAVIYKFNVKQGCEKTFQEAWAERTKEIAAQLGGWGSRLHRADDGGWVAYAQWPNREAWEAANRSTGPDSDAKRAVAEATDSVETLFCLDVVEDLLAVRLL